MIADFELWAAYRQTRATDVRDQLIEKHLVLVKYAAARIAGRLPSHLRMDDLYSAGLMGFLDAVEDYDPERGVEFSAYANPRIRGAIFDELRRLDCVPRRVRRRIRDAERAIDTLTQRLDRQPTDEEIAGELGIDVAAYHRLLGEGVTLLSLDGAPSPHAEGLSPMETLEDAETTSPFEALETKERRQLLGRVIDHLPEKERQVLALYYYEELTMQEVGRVLGVTESRVSQLHSSAVLRLRSTLRRQRVDPRDLGVALPPGGRAPRRRSARR
jgi:RNA polymerase sigma factor for flagellar operon FliA